MKIFVAKWALTDGILELEAVEQYDYFMEVRVKNRTVWLYKSQWAETREGAIVKANIIREKRLKSINRQLERLKAEIPRIEALKFQ